jgi:hypothetical protein
MLCIVFLYKKYFDRGRRFDKYIQTIVVLLSIVISIILIYIQLHIYYLLNLHAKQLITIHVPLN